MYTDAEDDGTTLEDLGIDIPDPVEVGALQDRTYEELATYVNTGSFEGEIVENTDDNVGNNDNTVRRRRDVSAGGSTAARRRSTNNSDVPW